MFLPAEQIFIYNRLFILVMRFLNFTPTEVRLARLLELCLLGLLWFINSIVGFYCAQFGFGFSKRVNGRQRQVMICEHILPVNTGTYRAGMLLIQISAITLNHTYCNLNCMFIKLTCFCVLNLPLHKTNFWVPLTILP